LKFQLFPKREERIARTQKQKKKKEEEEEDGGATM
jgi:hypothetical protein